MFVHDLAKSRSNRLKHGIDFAEARKLWEDPRLLERRRLSIMYRRRTSSLAAFMVQRRTHKIGVRNVLGAGWIATAVAGILLISTATSSFRNAPSPMSNTSRPA